MKNKSLKEFGNPTPSSIAQTAMKSSTVVNQMMKQLATMDPETIKMVIKTLQSTLASMGDNKMGESKRVKSNKEMVKEAIVKGILMHEKKKVIAKLMKEEIVRQKHVLSLTENLLNEGPLSGLFQGIRGGAQAFGKGITDTAQAFNSARMAGKASAQAQAQMKSASNQLTSTLKAVAQARQKYSQEMLKNAEVINQYHDAVLNMVTTWQQIQPLLAQNPNVVEKFENEIMNSMGQLKYDLESEKEQLNAFLDGLKKEAGVENVADAGLTARKSAQKARDDEAKESGKSSAGITRKPGLRRN